MAISALCCCLSRSVHPGMVDSPPATVPLPKHSRSARLFPPQPADSFCCSIARTTRMRKKKKKSLTTMNCSRRYSRSYYC
uniref:Putative secreted protein n=1 Tax=Anopheles marajoara TaxID=58244 RepID=A0A2M4CC82_9DIPT